MDCHDGDFIKTHVSCDFKPEMSVDNDPNIDDKLIDLVEQSPLLYNTYDPDYKCISKRLVYWRQIAAQLGLSVKTCQIKWKNIRYNYFRARKDKIDLTEAFRHKRFTRRLEFLDNIPVNEKKVKVKKFKIESVEPVVETESGLTKLNFQDYYKLNIEQKPEEVPIEETQSYQSNIISEDDGTGQNQVQVIEMETQTNNNFLDEKTSTGLSAIEMYCLSLAEPFSCMDMIERERVKFEISRIFKDARYVK